MSTEAEGRRELTQYGVLGCLAGGEGWGGGAQICTVMGGSYCTACPTKELLSSELLAIPAAAAAGILLNVVHKTPT